MSLFCPLLFSKIIAKIGLWQVDKHFLKKSVSCLFLLFI
nr:MAG TPA: hypothetical protein [Caudoviricetes sp.]